MTEQPLAPAVNSASASLHGGAGVEGGGGRRLDDHWILITIDYDNSIYGDAGWVEELFLESCYFHH